MREVISSWHEKLFEIDNTAEFLGSYFVQKLACKKSPIVKTERIQVRKNKNNSLIITYLIIISYDSPLF